MPTPPPACRRRIHLEACDSTLGIGSAYGGPARGVCRRTPTARSIILPGKGGVPVAGRKGAERHREARPNAASVPAGGHRSLWGCSSDATSRPATRDHCRQDRHHRVRDFSARADHQSAQRGPHASRQIIDATGDSVFNRTWSRLHTLAIHVPAGQGPNGLPPSVQIVSRIDDNTRALACAAWVKRALN